MDNIHEKDVLIVSSKPEMGLIKLKNQHELMLKNLLLQSVIVSTAILFGIYLIFKDSDRLISFFLGEKEPLEFIENLGRDSEKNYLLKFKNSEGKKFIIPSSIKVLRKINSGEKIYGIKYKEQIYSDEIYFGFAILGIIIILCSLGWLYFNTFYLIKKLKIISKLISEPHKFDVISACVINAGFKYSKFLLVLNHQYIINKSLSGELKDKIEKKFNDSDNISSVNSTEHYSMGDNFLTRISYKFSYGGKEYFNVSPLINYKSVIQNITAGKIWIAVKRADPDVNYFIAFHG